MAHITENTANGAAFVDWVCSPFATLSRWIVGLAEDSARAKVLAVYARMSDDELAQFGLRRDQIVDTVYGSRN